MASLPFSPAADRNKEPILEALQRLLPSGGRLLEVASGTGQHAAWLSAGLPGWEWQPTEANSAALPTIAARLKEAEVTNVHAPCLLNATDRHWPSEDETMASAFRLPFDALYCANLLHISPWAACLGLMAGAGRHLAPQGLLLIYGPFILDGISTAPSNLDFDATLREQNPAWGLRHLSEVEQAATNAGLRAREHVAMPANNSLLVFEKMPLAPHPTR